MACAVPVVASDIGGLRELIKDGQDGILVPERDPVALSEALVRALGLEGKRMGNAARKTVQSSFSMQRGIEETLAFYMGTAGRVAPSLLLC